MVFKNEILKWCCTVLFFGFISTYAQTSKNTTVLHVWEVTEIELHSSRKNDNYYTAVSCWVALKGPNFLKKVYGFWDGENVFKVRIVATEPGEWSWTSGSNQPNDEGLNNKSGKFTAIAWTEAQKQENSVRRGFIRPTTNGHALEYTDGTPFFMVGDTWLAGTTWRLPFRNTVTSTDYEPGPGIGFEDAVMYRKRQGFNSVSMIAAFPNWETDTHPSTYADANGVFLRNAWEKFGYDVSDTKGTDASGGVSYWGTFTAKNMRDEFGNLPFEMSEIHKGVSDFNHINPEYFKSLDKKMTFLSEQGFVPLLETVRRDVGPSWDAYFDFNESFARYVQYLVARYGAYNFIFSAIHLDWIPEDFSLSAKEFNTALTYHLNKYGPMPFEQPVTVLINNSTYVQFGHGETVPWLSMHSVGNKPRDHRMADSLETIFRLKPPYPVINFEPYYTGWRHEINQPGGEQPEANSERDIYFSRAQMYGSVLSGGLSGHVHGTASYDITTTGEPSGARPHFWEALQYGSANNMGHLRDFMLIEKGEYQNLELAREHMRPNKAKNAPEDGLDGWAYMMRNRERDFALLYFENASELPTLYDFVPNTTYSFQWYHPVNGTWEEEVRIKSNKKGVLKLPDFPEDNARRFTDWAAKIILN